MTFLTFLIVMVAVAYVAAAILDRKRFEREEIRDKAMEAEKSDELRRVAKAITELLFTTIVPNQTVRWLAQQTISGRDLGLWYKEAVEDIIHNELLARLGGGDEANRSPDKVDVIPPR